MYGMPQPTNYGQYGFGAYGGFPNQAAAAGTPGAAAPGMASPVAATAAMGLGAPQSPADPTAAAQAAQGQWAGADPSSYYSNYWGGEPRFAVSSCNWQSFILLLQVIMASKPPERQRPMLKARLNRLHRTVSTRL